MNDFEIIESQLAKVKELRNYVEGIEKTNFNNINNKAIIERNFEISINSQSTLQERCKSINVLYHVGQKKMIREIIQNKEPSSLRILVKAMINTPPIGDSIEKIASNRNTWIDESIWQLSKVRVEDSSCNATTEASTKDENLTEIMQLLDCYKHHFDNTLQLSGVVNLAIGMLNHSDKELQPSSTFTSNSNSNSSSSSK